MTVLLSEKYNDYYEKYKYDELTFSGTIIKSSGLISRDIYLKAGNKKWPCSILSASIMGIRISATLSPEELTEIRGEERIYIHFSFMGLKPNFIPITFLVPYVITDQTNISNQERGSHMLTLSIAESPPDFLIRILGELIGVQTITTKRAESRIAVNETTAKELGLKSARCRLFCNDRLQDCRLKDLSFKGCQIIVDSRPSIDKRKIHIEIIFRDPEAISKIPGKVLRFSYLRESGDKAMAGVQFEEQNIPHDYTMRLHNLLG